MHCDAQARAAGSVLANREQQPSEIDVIVSNIFVVCVSCNLHVHTSTVEHAALFCDVMRHLSSYSWDSDSDVEWYPLHNGSCTGRRRCSYKGDALVLGPKARAAAKLLPANKLNRQGERTEAEHHHVASRKHERLCTKMALVGETSDLP